MYSSDDVLFYIDGDGYAKQVVKNPFTLSCDVKKKKSNGGKKLQRSSDDSICITIHENCLEKEEEKEERITKVTKVTKKNSSNITCSGCMNRQPGQLAHMDYDGCLFNDEFSIV
jgi:hypothetical protein